MANIRTLIESTVAKHGDHIAFTVKEAPGIYTNISYTAYYDEARALGTALINEEMAGNRIALFGLNSYNWWLANTAIYFSGSVSVPLDKELEYGEFENSLIRGEVSYIFYAEKQKPLVDQALASGKTMLKGAIALYDAEEGMTINRMKAQGRAAMKRNKAIDKVEIDDHGLGLLLFTSGTTSNSKAVMLSQHNIAFDAEVVANGEPIYDTDTNIALLPYHHIFGSTGQWVLLYAGAKTVFCDGLKYIQKNMCEYGVSVFIGVPLIIEAMYKKIMTQVEKKGLTKSVKTLSVVSRTLNSAGIDVRRKMFSSVLENLGGKLRLVVIGGAAADAECIKGFKAFGVDAIQGYGLTETAPVISAERPDKSKPGSVGFGFDGIELDICDPDERGIGEVITRGPNVMMGYYNDPEATTEVFDEDGWFHTGDLGYFDKHGYLFLAGRKKNVIVLRNGKNVFPEELEALIAPHPYVAENVVLGIPDGDDERDLVVTLKLVYNPDNFQGMEFDDIYKKVWADVDAVNETLPPYKRIKRLILTDQEMIKTSTGKVRRFKEIEAILEERKNAGGKLGGHK